MPTTTKTTTNGKKTISKIRTNGDIRFLVKVLRTNGDIVITLKAHPTIENFFKKAASGITRTSSMYKDQNDQPLKFYETQTHKEPNDLDTFLGNFYNQYGNAVIYNDKANVALLRTKGISEGIELKTKNMYSEETLKSFVEQLQKFTGMLYATFIKEVSLVAKVEVQRGI